MTSDAESKSTASSSRLAQAERQIRVLRRFLVVLALGLLVTVLALFIPPLGCRNVETHVVPDRMDQSSAASQASRDSWRLERLEQGPSLQQLKAVQIGWSKDLVIQQLGAPLALEEHLDELTYSPWDGVSDGGYAWIYLFKMNNGVVINITKTAYCVLR